MRDNFWRRLRRLPADENAATVEWLLVAGVAVIVAFASNAATATAITYIFGRTAIVIALPFG